VQLTAAERPPWAALGKKRGHQALEEVATLVTPAPILAWQRTLVAPTCAGAAPRTSVGRPRVDPERADRGMPMAKAKRRWGYDRSAGALAELGDNSSDPSVGNRRKRRGLPTAAERQKTTTWQAGIRTPPEG
jgi:hypothetical protein